VTVTVRAGPVLTVVLLSGERDGGRGQAAGGTQHGPRGVCGDRGRQEVHVHEGVHQLPVLQRGDS